eukprot:c17267_g1_i1 orf=99-2606(-)
MTGGEQYLEGQAKRMRKEYLEAAPSSHRLRLPPLQVEHLALRHAPSSFRDRLRHIMQCADGDAGAAPSQALSRLVVGSADVAGLEAAEHFQRLGGQAATIIGSSQQGKTSLLNSLLGLFGFLHPDLVFPQADLLPTNTKDHVGLPFPLRLDYGPKYTVVLQRWDSRRLQDAMCKVAEGVLAQNADFFDELESGLESVEEGSFLEFVTNHGKIDQNNVYVSEGSAVKSLHADGGIEVHDFMCPEQPSRHNPSFEVHEAVREFLLQLVEDSQWLRYERITLKCPSQLLRHLKTGCESEPEMCILDVPGVGIVDDNNLLVEELVLRDTLKAGTVIVLTGERSFTQDVIHVLRRSVFERLLDPLVLPRPTVAITNSRNLRGLKEEEMEAWRETTLHGSLGWNMELKSFADDTFSGRRHRELQSLQPDLFPNDLDGFMHSREGACEKGISMLVGYFLRLPQEALLASVADVLEHARSIMKMVDQLWQAEKVSWKGLQSCRLMKEVRGLREEEFKRDLDAELSFSTQRRIFGFETEVEGWEQQNLPQADKEKGFNEPQQKGSKAFASHLAYIQGLFNEQNRKLTERYKKLKASKGDFKHEIPKMVKDSLIHIASQWDEHIGYCAYRRFLSHGEEISKLLYQKWARQLFLGAGRNDANDKQQDQACQFMKAYLQSSAAAAINEDVFKYTLTHGLRLQAWNLDLKDITKVLGARRGRSGSAAHDKVWSSLRDIMRNKEAFFKEHMLEHMTLQSTSIQQLVRLLKEVILHTFADCERNFLAVMDALERIANGKLVISEDPVIVLREELGGLVKIIEGYLSHHKEMRNSFGAQELERVLRTQSEV